MGILDGLWLGVAVPVRMIIAMNLVSRGKKDPPDDQQEPGAKPVLYYRRQALPRS